MFGLGLALAACKGATSRSENKGDTTTTTPHGGAERTLVYAGDFFAARSLNFALQEETTRDQILSTEVRDILRNADVAMVNSEGVVAAGGAWYAVGEMSHRFRAHPILIETFKQAGLDVLTLGNNHINDYGPDAITEMLDRLNEAGIAYTGAGYNLSDATMPAYLQVGDTIVAIVSADLTYASRYRAGKKRAGSQFYDALKNEEIATRTTKTTRI